MVTILRPGVISKCQSFKKRKSSARCSFLEDIRQLQLYLCSFFDILYLQMSLFPSLKRKHQKVCCEILLKRQFNKYTDISRNCKSIFWKNTYWKLSKGYIVK